MIVITSAYMDVAKHPEIGGGEVSGDFTSNLNSAEV